MPNTPQSHYFVPHPSWWPALGAAALFCLGLGASLAVNQRLSGLWLSRRRERGLAGLFYSTIVNHHESVPSPACGRGLG